MAFLFVQSKSAASTGTAPAITFTSAPTSGNLLVCVVSCFINSAITMTSSGWTALTSIATGAGTSQIAYRMFWKMALPSESSTVTAASGNGGYVIMAAEYNTGGLGVAAPKESAQSNAASTSQPTPSVTPVTGGEILAVCGASIRNNTTTFSGETIGGIAIGSGVTEREDPNQLTNSANGCLYDLITNSTNGSYAGASTATNSAVGAGGIAIFTPVAPTGNNFQFARAADNGNGVMSVTERIR